MDILKKLTKLENEASEFGFKWENADQIIAQIRSEIAEIETHLKDHDKVKLQDEIGDLMHAAFSLSVFCQLEPYTTLENSIKKFERRFRETQKLARNEGFKNLNGQPFDKLMALWDRAKNSVG